MEPFSIKKRLKSFTYAGKGIKSFVCREHNVWIHLSIALLTIMAGFFFEIHRIEWIAIIICIGVVIAAEAFNTAIERLVNLTSPEWNPIAGEVKDIAAGAVLICAVAAAIVGLVNLIYKPLRRRGSNLSPLSHGEGWGEASPSFF